MNKCSGYDETKVCFWNMDWALVMSLSIFMLQYIVWIFFLIPHIPSMCCSKLKWLKPVQMRYYVKWIIIIAMMITELISDSTTIELCHCNGNTFLCLTRITVYVFLFFMWSWFIYNPSLKFKHEYAYLANVYTCSQAKDYLQELQKAKPVITFYAINYHLRTEHDSNGGTMEQRYNTDQFQETHFYNHYIQSMPDIPHFSSNLVTRMKLTKCFDFIDDQLKAEHKAKFQSFHMNSWRDEEIDTREEVHFPGFTERILVVPDNEGKPIWMNKACFWIATFFLMSLPYQLLFKWKTEKIQYCINKRIDSVNATSQICGEVQFSKDYFKKSKTLSA